jgi:hypothetical protein
VQVPRRCGQPTASPAAQEQLLAGGTLDETLAVRIETAEIPPVDPNNVGGEGQESICTVEYLELLAADTK